MLHHLVRLRQVRVPSPASQSHHLLARLVLSLASQSRHLQVSAAADHQVVLLVHAPVVTAVVLHVAVAATVLVAVRAPFLVPAPPLVAVVAPVAVVLAAVLAVVPQVVERSVVATAKSFSQ